MTFLQVFSLVRTYGPELADLVAALVRKHQGDPDLVRTELRYMTDHGVRGEAAEAGFDARVAAARERNKGG